MTEIPTTPSDSVAAELSEETVHAILVPGFWLGGWAWQTVEAPLSAAGIQTHAITLPGLDGKGSEGVTLTDHIDVVEQMAKSLDGDVVLVGHSGGGAVVQGVIDRQPDIARRVIYVDSGPLIAGVALMPDTGDDDVELPSWDELAAQNSSVEGMDEQALERFRTKALPHPVGVATAPIRVTNERRFDVPASMICTSFGSEMLTQLIESGTIPSELGSVKDVHYVDLPTGHWPMFSRPADLASVLRDEILRR